MVINHLTFLRENQEKAHKERAKMRFDIYNAEQVFSCRNSRVTE